MSKTVKVRDGAQGMSKKTTEPQDKTRFLAIKNKPGHSTDELIADMATGGIVNNAGLVTEFSKAYLGDLSLTDCAKSLEEKAKAVHGGDLKALETMLASQAVALDTIFSSMAMQAKLNMGGYMNAAEKYMRLALKAQGQCRATVETLAFIKNPQPYIQNNRAHYQQINNGIAVEKQSQEPHAPEPTCAGKNQKNTNGLLTNERNDHETVDFTGTRAAGSVDQDLEALEP